LLALWLCQFGFGAAWTHLGATNSVLWLCRHCRRVLFSLLVGGGLMALFLQ
jgi:hypothetical protein